MKLKQKPVRNLTPMQLLAISQVINRDKNLTAASPPRTKTLSKNQNFKCVKNFYPKYSKTFTTQQRRDVKK